MKISLRLIGVFFIVLSLLFELEVEGGKVKQPGGGGGVFSNVGKAVGGKKGGLGKKAAAAAVVVGGGAAGYVAYKGIKKAVKHGRHDDSSEEYYGNGGNYGNYGRERQYYGSGLRISAWSPSFLILSVVALRAINWY